jgi:hypothetical protein
MKRKRTLACALITVATLGIGPVSGVHAADQAGVPDLSKLNSFSVSASEFESLRKASRRVVPAGERAKERGAFLESASEFEGSVYLADEVDVVDLGPAIVTIPTDVTLDSLEITADPGQGVVVEAEATSRGKSRATPTSGAEEFASKGGGQYVITVKGVGSGLFTWRKFKIEGESDSAADYWAYRRTAVGEPANWSNRPDPRVAYLYIRNYPMSGTYKVLKSWLSESAPSSDFDGDCNNTPVYFELGAKGASVGVSFLDCARNDVSQNHSVPGEMRILMDQGKWVGASGTRATGYISGFTVKPKATPYFHDQQKIAFAIYGDEGWLWPPKITCSSIDGDTTCND